MEENWYHLCLTYAMERSWFCRHRRRRRRQVNFFGRSHQCQLVMNGDLDTLFVIGSCPFNDIQFIQSNENTLIYTNWSFRFRFPLYEKKQEQERERDISESDQLLLLSAWICHWCLVSECIVVMRSCGKYNDDDDSECAPVSPTNKRDVVDARKLVQLYTCANDNGRPGNAILLRTERKRKTKKMMRAVERSVCLLDDHVRWCGWKT